MTVIDENANFEAYNYLEFPEFLEMIGRIADIKFIGTSLHKDLPLQDRIANVLDQILPLISIKR
jgi:hypothetical protein